MPEMTIRLVTDPETGKKDIIVDLRSDADSLPHEHEQLHRQLVEKLIEGGTLKAGEVGKVVIQREDEEQQQSTTSTGESHPQRESQSEGN